MLNLKLDETMTPSILIECYDVLNNFNCFGIVRAFLIEKLIFFFNSIMLSDYTIQPGPILY